MFTKEQIQTMTGAELLKAYNSATGSNVKRFASAADGRKRLLNFLEQQTQVREEAELEEEAQTADVARTAPNINVAVAGSNTQVGELEDNVAIEKKKVKGKKRGVVGFDMTYATAEGKSVLQKGSTRRKIFEAVAAAGPAGISVDALDEQFSMRTRPYLLKLRDQGHIA